MREKDQSRIEAHVAGICIKDDSVLVAKRSPDRKIYPGLWECGGGQVKPGENFEEAITRQMKEELGIDVKPLHVFRTYEISVPELEQQKIPGIKFACSLLGYIRGEGPTISEEHTEYRWQPIGKLDEFEMIPGLKEDIISARELINKG